MRRETMSKSAANHPRPPRRPGAACALGALAQQVEVEHLARDRRGGRAAVAAVLHQHGERDLRVVGGGVGDEEGVVAVALLHALLVVLLARLHADHLGGAGLAGHEVGRALGGAHRRAARARHVDHRRLHQLDVLGLDRERLAVSHRQLADLLRARVLHGAHQPRVHRRAAVGEGGHGGGQLQGRGEPVALPDAHADGVARVPLLLEALPLPVGRRLQPRAAPRRCRCRSSRRSRTGVMKRWIASTPRSLASP